MKKRSLLSLLKLRFKLYLRWVAHQRRKNIKPVAECFESEPEKVEAETKCKDSWAGVGCGCACSIIVIWAICKAVGWAWSIHWLFGILLLLFIISLFG